MLIISLTFLQSPPQVFLRESFRRAFPLQFSDVTPYVLPFSAMRNEPRGAFLPLYGKSGILYRSLDGFLPFIPHPPPPQLRLVVPLLWFFERFLPAFPYTEALPYLFSSSLCWWSFQYDFVFLTNEPTSKISPPRLRVSGTFSPGGRIDPLSRSFVMTPLGSVK